MRFLASISGFTVALSMLLMNGKASAEDSRELVEFPAMMREHTLANMRDHLQAMQEIQAALAASRFDRAAELAESRLGMAAMKAHDAAHAAKFMPPPMQAIGSDMHHAASRFALKARDAAVDHDLAGSLAALADVTQQCVACHAGYRLQ